ncbi:MAG: hypothetical protein ACKVKH_18485, partial [Verrucomicrobiales bacterium]
MRTCVTSCRHRCRACVLAAWLHSSALQALPAFNDRGDAHERRVPRHAEQPAYPRRRHASRARGARAASAHGRRPVGRGAHSAARAV